MSATRDGLERSGEERDRGDGGGGEVGFVGSSFRELALLVVVLVREACRIRVPCICNEGCAHLRHAGGSVVAHGA